MNILDTIVTSIKIENATVDVIKAVQVELSRVGLLETVDGICGPKTLAAFKQFKQLTNLGEPEYLGATTARKLQEYKPTATPQSVLKIAASYIGYKETPPGSNKTQFGAWYGQGLNGQPWCAMWVSFVFYHAGLPLSATTPKGFAYCPYGVAWFKKQGRFFQEPKVGDVVFFDFNKDSVSDHVGIVELVHPDGRNITTIEGNTSAASNSNGGEVQRRVRNLNLLQGFGRPNWS